MFRITNDLNRIVKSDALYKTYINSEFSIVYILLMLASVSVCTLGLLVGSSPVVIGGMLISPLMWPLMKVAVGISSEKTDYIRQAIGLIIFSTVFGGLVSFVITYLSPVKTLTAEIIARTNPTLLDVVVALAAGGVAALAISQPRISESIAGVAIATSLLPPLCVGGIGLALNNTEVFSRSFLLFFANAISIIFISAIVFAGLGIKQRAEEGVRKMGVFFTFVILLVTAIPLFAMLRQYSFKTLAYSDVQDRLERNLKKISSNIHVENVRVSIPSDSVNFILVEADVLLPEDVTLSYQEQQDIKNSLEKSVERPVNLNLRLQKTISITTEEDQMREFLKQNIRDIFVQEISDLNEELSVSSLEILYGEKADTWFVKSVLRADPDLVFTKQQKDFVARSLADKTGVTVSLSLEIVPRLLIVDEALLEEGVVEATQSVRVLDAVEP